MNSVVCITSAGILWGIIAIFISLLKDLGFNSLQCVAIRVFFSALCLVIYLSIFDRSKLKIEFKDIIYFLGTGIFSIIFFNYCYFEAIEVIGGVAIPALLLYMAPIFVMIMSFFFFPFHLVQTGRSPLCHSFRYTRAGCQNKPAAFTDVR